MEKLLESQGVHLKEPTRRLTYSDSLPPSSSTGVAACRVLVAEWERLKCLALGQEEVVPFLSPTPAEPWNKQASAIFETPLTWPTLFNPPWRSSETPPHPTYGPTQAAFPYDWLVLAYVSQLPKLYQTSNG